MANLSNPAYIQVGKKRKRQERLKTPSTALANLLLSDDEDEDTGDDDDLPIAKKPATKKSISLPGQITNTPEEQRRRALRSQRFLKDQPIKRENTPTETIMIMEEGSDVWQFSAVVGTSTDIEKPYFRLTSAADPRTVRPLPILKKTYKHLRKKWRKEHNYTYICEQFKSLRQDLTVQCIRNEFTVKVYETHARIALEKGDCSQYNQCGSQLKYLYDQGVEGNKEEFTAYRLLYFLLTQNWPDINSLLGEIKKGGDHHSDCVDHALQVRSAMATGNYHRLFKLYQDAPNMGGYLMDQFIERERVQALIILCKAYQMGLPITFIIPELGFDDIKELGVFFNKHGIPRNRAAPMILDTKSALGKLQEASKKTNKQTLSTPIMADPTPERGHSSSRRSLQLSNTDTPDELFHPHTLTALVILLAWLFYAGIRTNHEDTENSVKLGILASICCFVFIGMLQFRDGPFVRPSIPFWRAILSLSVLYQLLLVFMLFLSKDEARQFMTNFDPALGIKLPERSYAGSCETTLENIMSQVDIFVVAHSLGWYGKSLIVRDYWLCWILSVAFELLEYSLAHHLNNFAECWWDHWILDVLLCNWAGIYFGMKTCQYLEVKEYSWVGLRQIKSLRGKAKRAVQQFTPKDWTRFEWKATSSPKNYFGTVGFMLVFLQCELNCFYLKAVLWIPVEHPLNTYRLVLAFLYGLPAARDLYQYISDNNTKRLGVHAWLFICNVMTESLICLKYANEFTVPAPMFVKIAWSIVLSFMLVIFPLWRFVISPKKPMEVDGKDD